VTETSNAGVTLHVYTDASLDGAEGISIDGAGNIWVSNSLGASVTELSNTGAILSGVNGFIGSGLSSPESVAADGSGNVWVSSLGGNYLMELIGIGAPVITPIVAGLPVIPTTDGSSKLGTRP
jgi:streptogramin lyase